MAHTNPWDESVPVGATTPANTIDDLFRQLKLDIAERLIEAGLNGWRTDDPVAFQNMILAGASPDMKMLDPTGTFRIRKADGNSLLVADSGSAVVSLFALSVGAQTALATLIAAGLISANGGITTGPGQAALFQGPATFTKNVAVNGGQGAITPITVSPATGTVTIDWNNGNNRHYVLSSNIAFVFNNPQAGAVYLLKITQDPTGSRTLTWPANVYWPGNIVPTFNLAAGKSDLITLYYDGAYFLANLAGSAYVV